MARAKQQLEPRIALPKEGLEIGFEVRLQPMQRLEHAHRWAVRSHALKMPLQLLETRYARHNQQQKCRRGEDSGHSYRQQQIRYGDQEIESSGEVDRAPACGRVEL